MTKTYDAIVFIGRFQHDALKQLIESGQNDVLKGLLDT